MSQVLGIRLDACDGRLQVAITPPAPLPVAALMRGRTPEEVAALIPRIFNLCGAAQGHAVRLALGLPVEGEAARREIWRDHLAKLCLHWPRLLDLPPQPLPPGWADGGMALSRWVWGGEEPSDLLDFLGNGQGVAPVLSAIAQRFAPHEATAHLPPLLDPLSRTAQENSPAGRVADHALMQQAAARWGHGPLWRALGRAVDLARLAQAPLAVQHLPGGAVAVAAARGSFALTVQAEAGQVTALTRLTPTDHLLAPGGALERSLSTLPAAKIALAGLVIDILDPCVAVSLTRGDAHA